VAGTGTAGTALMRLVADHRQLHQFRLP